jgi:hypothetical protein
MTKYFRYLVIILIFGKNSISFSQDLKIDSLVVKRVIFSSSLLEYFPNKFNAGNLNFGAEIYLGNRKSILMNFGYLNSYGSSNGVMQVTAISTSGFRLQLEGKHFLNKRKLFEPAIFVFWPHIFQYNSKNYQNSGYYLSTNLFYQKTLTFNEETVLDYIDDQPYPGTSHYKINEYKTYRKLIGLNFKIGYHCIKKSGFIVDYSIGFGGKYMKYDTQNRKSDDSNWVDSELESAWIKFPNSKSGIFPTVSYQLKLGWSF